MNYFDIILIVPMLWGGFKGFKKGLIVEVASLLALLLGVWGGVKFSSYSANYLGELFSISEQLMPLISFAVTFIIIVVLVFLLAKLVQKLVKAVSLSTLNQLAGMAFGALKFTFIISIVLTLINNINAEIEFITPEARNESLLYNPVSSIAPSVIPGLEEINLTKAAEDAVKEQAINRIEEASVSDLKEELSDE